MRQTRRQAPGAPLAEPTDLLALAATASLIRPLPALPGPGLAVAPPLFAGLPRAAITVLACVLGLAVAGVTLPASDPCGPHAASAR